MVYLPERTAGFRNYRKGAEWLEVGLSAIELRHRKRPYSAVWEINRAYQTGATLRRSGMRQSCLLTFSVLHKITPRAKPAADVASKVDRHLPSTGIRGVVDYRHRGDLVAYGLELPRSHPAWAREPGRIWREVDAACESAAPDAVRARHVVLTSPNDSPRPKWQSLVRGIAQRTLVRRGPSVPWAINALRDAGGEWLVRPHAHLLMTPRGWKHNASFGRSIPA